MYFEVLMCTTRYLDVVFEHVSLCIQKHAKIEAFTILLSENTFAGH